MRRTLITIAVAATATFGLAAAAVSSADATPALASSAHHAKRVCAAARPGEASCLAEELVDTATGARVNPLASAGSAARPAAISGKTPSDIRSAYGLTSTGSSGRTVAIVDAYGYPNASRDLAVYRSQFGLSACTTANGCLTVVSQTGSSSLPAYNLGWSQEQALDLDAVSATCPDCKILLVQAKTPSFANLGAAVKTAAAHAGVVAISNSYGGGDSADSSYGSYYNHPGVAVTASTGDNGYQGASFPASSHYVTAVGGTSLTKTTSTRGWSESAWSGSGSGCTTLNVAPAGQTSGVTGCSGRAIADVSADADPNTGLAVYAPTSSSASSWAQYGGTSLSSPIVAGVYALSGRTTGYANTLPYAASGGLNDVTSGSNGSCASYCTAGPGYDGPTGLGTPNGTSAF